MTLAAALFALAALGGAFLATRRLRNQSLPFPVAVGHGLLAASGLAALAVAFVHAGMSGPAKVPLILFVLAALGGLGLFSFQLRKKPLPIAVVLGHGLLALTALALLLLGLFGGALLNR